MKKSLKYIALAILVCVGVKAQADCSVNLAILEIPQTENVPENTIKYLTTKLEQLSTADGITADPSLGQFFIAAKFNHLMEDVLPGPPTQTVLHTNLTLYIGDLNSQTIYATTSLELRGVGNSLQRAYINALRGLNAKNKTVESFIEKGKNKIIDYYNRNYQQILSQAAKAAAQHNYEEALWRVSMIPECSVGFNQASAALIKYFQAYIDQEGTALLNAATAAWAAQPDARGAEKALSYLMSIDPESKAYPQAQRLMDEIKASVKSDRDFELRTKYNDRVDMERRRIDAAKEVGVAWGRGQQPTTTNVMWIR